MHLYLWYNFFMKLKTLLSPKFGIVLTPIIFGLSQVVILGYYWFFGGYAGKLNLTISKYVGLELWSSVFFAICNLLIVILMLRYYLVTWKKLSVIWLILSLIQTIGFIGLSICPHNAFMSDGTRETINTIHILMARMMFLAMFGMMLERLRLNGLKNSVSAKACLAFLGYSLIYIISYVSSWNILWDMVLIWESGYIYAFMGALILSRPR